MPNGYRRVTRPNGIASSASEVPDRKKSVNGLCFAYVQPGTIQFMNKSQTTSAQRRIRVLTRDLKRARKLLSEFSSEEVEALLKPRKDEIAELREEIAKYRGRKA
jgi:hypothetical protein